MPQLIDLPLVTPALEDQTVLIDDPAGLWSATRAPLASLLSLVWPVGSIFISAVDTDPATLLGFGTWEAFGAGRVLVGLDAGQTDFDTLLETGGAKDVTLTEAQMPSHTHAVNDPGHTHLTQRYPTATGGNSGFTNDTSMSGTPTNNTLPTASATTGITLNNTGSGQAHSNLQPYITCRFWRRTA